MWNWCGPNGFQIHVQPNRACFKLGCVSGQLILVCARSELVGFFLWLYVCSNVFISLVLEIQFTTFTGTTSIFLVLLSNNKDGEELGERYGSKYK